MESLYYELKPILYFGVGFWCSTLDHPAKWISVAMFVGASVTISYWRRKYRKG